MKTVDDAAALDREIATKPTAALFLANWCPFCRSFAPIFAAVTDAPSVYEPMQVILDDEDNPLWDTYHVDVVPTVVFFKGGKVVKRLDGRAGVGLNENDLRAAVRGA